MINGKALKIDFKSGWFLKFEKKRVFSCDFQLLKARIIDSIKTAFYEYLKVEFPKITKKASSEIFKAVESLFFQENKKAVEKSF